VNRSGSRGGSGIDIAGFHTNPFVGFFCGSKPVDAVDDKADFESPFTFPGFDLFPGIGTYTRLISAKQERQPGGGKYGCSAFPQKFSSLHTEWRLVAEK
jgi:hypothetical protein